MGQRKEIKEILESILGTSIQLTSDKADKENQAKLDFIRIIDLFEEAWQRQNKPQWTISTFRSLKAWYIFVLNLLHQKLYYFMFILD